MDIAIIGASGYAGSELYRLADAHPRLNVVVATAASQAGRRVSEAVPALAAIAGDQRYAPTAAALTAEVDTAFIALPHGESQSLVPDLLARGVRVIDLGADFRLKDAATYAHWYGHEHVAPQYLGDAVYGLVERHRHELPGARLVASPGCYPTASILALGPFADAGLLERGSVIVNALSGTSGAGRSLSERLQFSRLAGNAEAYGLLNHRHTAEMEMELGEGVLFTPHLLPVSRGMLVTAYARVRDPNLDPLALLREAYADEPFVVVQDEPPALKDAVGSNLCVVSARIDPRTGWLIALSAIDNLIKGAAGQAIQAWNVATGLAETTGLPRAGVTP